MKKSLVRGCDIGRLVLRGGWLSKGALVFVVVDGVTMSAPAGVIAAPRDPLITGRLVWRSGLTRVFIGVTM